MCCCCCNKKFKIIFKHVFQGKQKGTSELFRYARLFILLNHGKTQLRTCQITNYCYFNSQLSTVNLSIYVRSYAAEMLQGEGNQTVNENDQWSNV
jgi:hypothetical protein